MKEEDVWREEAKGAGDKAPLSSEKKEKKEKKLSSFLLRVGSGIVLLLFLFLILPRGGMLLLAMNYLLSLLACYELLKCFSLEKDRLAFFPFLFITIHYYALYRDRHAETVLLVLYFVLCSMNYVFHYPKKSIREIGLYFLAFPYTGFLFSYIYQSRMLMHGAILVWLIFLSSWAADSCAYAAGMLFGRHKMTPVLSPKKTWEGAVGGVLGAFLLTYFYGLYFSVKQQGLFHSPLKLALSVAVASLFSIVGDLTASGIKRDFGIKDYSHLIPGHGGILDRFDSVLFTAPIIYYALVFFVQ